MHMSVFDVCSSYLSVHLQTLKPFCLLHPPPLEKAVCHPRAHNRRQLPPIDAPCQVARKYLLGPQASRQPTNHPPHGWDRLGQARAIF